MSKENIRASVPDSVEERINTIAKRWGISKSEWVARACEAYLKPAPDVSIQPAVVEKRVPVDTEDLERYALMMKQKHMAELDGLLGIIRVLRKKV